MSESITTTPNQLDVPTSTAANKPLQLPKSNDNAVSQLSSQTSTTTDTSSTEKLSPSTPVTHEQTTPEVEINDSVEEDWPSPPPPVIIADDDGGDGDVVERQAVVVNVDDADFISDECGAINTIDEVIRQHEENDDLAIAARASPLIVDASVDSKQVAKI